MRNAQIGVGHLSSQRTCFGFHIRGRIVTLAAFVGRFSKHARPG